MMTPVKDPKVKTKQAGESGLKRLTRHQMFIPLAALALLVLFNLDRKSTRLNSSH